MISVYFPTTFRHPLWCVVHQFKAIPRCLMKRISGKGRKIFQANHCQPQIGPLPRIFNCPGFTSYLSANAIIPFQQIGQIVKGFKLVCTVRPFVLVTHSQRFRSSNRQLFAHCLFNCCYGTCGRPNVDRNWILSEVNPPIGLW